MNITVLGAAFAIFGGANAIVPEAGILSVIVAGLVLRARHPPQLEGLKRFELELTELGIGVLFILLAAKLDLSRFGDRAGELGIVLAVVIGVARPLNVLLGTLGLGFGKREKFFLSWMAPRGIVAASMASLFSLRLTELGYANADLLETITFAVIGVTVLGLGLTAPLVASLLRLERPERGSWVLAGTPDLARPLVDALVASGVHAETISDRERPDDPGRSEVEDLLALAEDIPTQDALVRSWSIVLGPQNVARFDRALPNSDGSFGGGRTHGGARVWDGVRGPAHLAGQLRDGEIALQAVKVTPGQDRDRFGPDFLPLLLVRGGHARFPSADGGVPDNVDAVVVLRRRIPGLDTLIRDVLLIDRPGVVGGDIVRALLEDAAAFQPGLSVDLHTAALTSEPGPVPNAIGGGVAIPHVYDPAATKSAGYLASVPAGLEAPGPDGEPITLVFLVISPPGAPQEHLRCLSVVARLGTDRSVVDRLRRQGSRAGLLDVLADRS